MKLTGGFRAFATHSATHVAGAFLVMAGWAFFANRQHAFPEALTAGFVQGGLSATITLVLKKSLEGLSAWLHGRGLRLASLFTPPLVTCSVALLVLILCHKAAGTPEIAATISVPFSAALAYASLYNFGLWRLARKAR